MTTQPGFATHEVFNQSPPFEDVDSVCTRSAGGRCRRRQWRSIGAAGVVPIRKAVGFGCDGGAGRVANENRQSCAPSMNAATRATRSSFVRS